MTSEFTIRNRFSVSLAAALAWTLFACTGASHADELSKSETGIKVASVKQVALVGNPSRFDLKAYGDRFKQAIEIAAKEAEKPQWAWASDDEQ